MQYERGNVKHKKPATRAGFEKVKSYVTRAGQISNRVLEDLRALSEIYRL